MMEFRRLYTAMVTPFDDEGNVDFKRIDRLLEHLVPQNTEGLVLTGSTGESPTLTFEEKIAIYRHVMDRVGDKTHVIAGAGGNVTADSITLSQAAEDFGVHGLMLVCPPYNKPGGRGLKAHFSAIADAVKLPIMLYNIPGRTGTDMAVSVTAELSKVDNIVAIKEATGNVDNVTRLLNECADGFMVYSGDDPLTIPSMSVGAKGVVSVISHIAGNSMLKMIDSFESGKVGEAARMQRRLSPLIDAAFLAGNPAGIKTLLWRAGVGVGEVRLPLMMPSGAQGQRMDTLMKRYEGA